MDRLRLYNIIYAFAAREGRQEVLFGQSAPFARKAFMRSLAGARYFPELWFELPLAGERWFDLHVLVSRSDLDADAVFDPGTCGFCPDAFAWFAVQEQGVRQLALSWDTGSGDVHSPAVQLLRTGWDVDPNCDFLEAVGRPDAVPAYRAFTERLPHGWFPCYTGVFPRREAPFLRIECIPDCDLQPLYAADPALLQKHLQQTGFTELGDTVLERCQILAKTPFQLEFQFDVMPNGGVSSTLGASVRFNQPPGTAAWEAFDPDGAAGVLMRLVEQWGLADDRWKHLADTAFCKRASLRDQACTLYCYPAFLKLRWRDGAPVDAKTYLIAGVQS